MRPVFIAGTGLACALVPYREKNESVIVMRPATKGCPAPG